MDTPIIPGYEILEALPQGGMSAVFKARQVSLDRVVVLKILPPSTAADDLNTEELLAEAKITAQLKHPNIVQVYDFGKSPAGIYYFVMEYISGYSVAQWIQRKRCLSTKDALLCAHCVAEALNYAWEAFGVVHCDIKPDNVMIDGDGTVKVADLGLARSVRSVMDKDKFQKGVAVGTPYYISPEQSQGRIDLDCRTDIYSLGAMLYHCLSGKMPFEGLPLLEVMDCQITDQIPDLLDVQPRASMAVACLIEKMMAKNPAHRQKDWPEVIRDMIRARSELLPEGTMSPAGASTVKRCAAREAYLKKQDAAAHGAPAPQPAAPPPAAPVIVARPRRWIKPEWLAAVIMVLALAVPAVLVVNMLMKSKPAAPPPEKSVPAPGPLQADPGTNSKALPADSPAANAAQAAALEKEAARAQENALAVRLLAEAAQWAQANPAKYNEALQQFTKIAVQFKGTRHALAAQAEIARIRERKRVALAAEMQALQTKAQPLVDARKWREAAKLFEQYAGAFKAETAAERSAKVKEWLDRDQGQQTELSQTAAEQERQWQGLLNDVAARLASGDPAAALAAFRQATNNAALPASRRELPELAGMLAEAAGMDQRLLDSFRAQKDQEVAVALTNGTENLVVRDVREDAIQVEKIIVVSAGQFFKPKVVHLQDLALEEKKARLGTNAAPGTALVHGLLALRDGNWSAAEAAWSQAGPFLAPPLQAKLQERKKGLREELARKDFILLLRAAQVEVADPLPGGEACLAAIGQKQFPPQTARLLAKSAAGYQEQYGATDFAKTYAPVLAAFQQAPAAPAPETERPADPSSAPVISSTGSADGDSARRALAQRNPGLTELNVAFVTDDEGKIVRAEIIFADLKDISPLAALPALRAIICAAIEPDEWRDSPVKAPLSDLAPLKSLPLQELCLSNTRVKDLAPLAGMPLTKLDLTGTRVTDLSALKGMPLRELTLSRLLIWDLKPLAGMPLEVLNIGYTEVADLAPLAGMQLRRLVAPATRIRDLKLLTGMPLTYVNISRTDVTDITPLTGMELLYLNLGQTRVRDLAPLSAMPLRSLDLNKTGIRDLVPVQDLALERLIVRGTRVKDLSPLSNMPLKWLDISESDVRDLAPLRGVPLKNLLLLKTAVRDLAPIQNAPIEEIWLEYSSDPQSAPENSKAFEAVLLRMPRLQLVNGSGSFRARRMRE